MKKKILGIFVCCILFLEITGCSTKKKSLDSNKQTNVDLNVCDEEDYLLNSPSINVEQIINNIVSNGPNTSSNPFDYIKENRDDYDILLSYPKETFEYAIKDLIETGANNGLKGYIEALLCHDINKNFKYDFESANDFLEKYKEFLTKSYSILNEYDKYALSLFEEYDVKETPNNEEQKEERYMIGYTFDDGRIIHFVFDVPYNNDSLGMAFLNNKITVNEFINRLDYVDELRDGGSKIYKYDKNMQIFGNEDFYTVVCNSMDNIKDIYVARYRESLNDKCKIKIDDLDGVSMTIKEGTLTRTSATIVVTDVSNKKSIYGSAYRIDKKDNGKWVELKPLIDNYAWTCIGYSVDKNNKLEMDINWKALYGNLENGEYRIVKSTSEAGEQPTHYITTEFVIE